MVVYIIKLIGIPMNLSPRADPPATVTVMCPRPRILPQHSLLQRSPSVPFPPKTQSPGTIGARLLSRETLGIVSGLLPLSILHPSDTAKFSTATSPAATFSTATFPTGRQSQTIPSKQEDRKSTRLNSSHSGESRMPSSA